MNIGVSQNGGWNIGVDQADAAAGGSSIKKVSGVAYASIKKIAGVAIASVKKCAGVA